MVELEDFMKRICRAIDIPDPTLFDKRSNFFTEFDALSVLLKRPLAAAERIVHDYRGRYNRETTNLLNTTFFQ